jgi:hypothetical protein
VLGNGPFGEHLTPGQRRLARLMPDDGWQYFDPW